MLFINANYLEIYIEIQGFHFSLNDNEINSKGNYYLKDFL